MDKYGLIGFPLGHSFSEGFFNQKFYSEGIDACYVNYEIADIAEFKHILQDNPNLKGMNVTIPYKEKVIKYLDELDPETAKKIGAVNVIKIVNLPKGKKKLIGYNSDVVGFTQSLEELVMPHHQKALILGTGGASKAVYHGLLSLGIQSKFVSRTPKKDQLSYSQLTPEIMAEYTIIVNTTPLGMYPKVDECPDIPYELLTPNHLLYDLLYNPDETLFMRRGKEQGAVVKNGLEMLLLQAFAAWDIWNR